MMAEILSSELNSNNNPFKKGWKKFRSLDRFTKGLIAGLFLLLLATSIIVNNRFDTRQRASELPKPTHPVRPTPRVFDFQGKPITMPEAAQRGNGAPGSPGERGLGVKPDTAEKLSNSRGKMFQSTRTDLPAAVDLSSTVGMSTYPTDSNNPPVGNQGYLGSCVAWAAGYFQRGYYAKRDNYYPPLDDAGHQGFSALFIYNQLNGGVDGGLAPSRAYDLLLDIGDVSQADFDPPGEYKDYLTQPTADQLTRALPYRIMSWSYIKPADITSIKATIASGNPITITIPIQNQFDYPDKNTCLVGLPPAGHYLRGYHQISGYAYDDRGLWIQNSWGTNWGCNGHIELSWDFITQYGGYAYAMVPYTPSDSPMPTTFRTPTPTPTKYVSPYSITISSPQDGTTVTKGSTLTITSVATSADVIKSVDLYQKSGQKTTKLCSDTTYPYGCNWQVPAKGKSGTQYSFYTIMITGPNGSNFFYSPPITITAR